MLTLTIRKGDRLHIGPDIVIECGRLKRAEKVAITAPRDVEIHLDRANKRDEQPAAK